MPNRKTTTRIYDASRYLKSARDRQAYLDAALADGDPQVIAAVLGDIAKAKGMTKVARAAGLGRESLYKALSPEGNPEFGTILKVMQALGYQLHATAAE